MAKNLGSSLYNAIRKLIRAPLVDKKAVDELVHDIQRSLLQADVNVKLVQEISERIRGGILEEKLPSGVSRHEHAVEVVYNELTKLIGERAKKLPIKTKKRNIFLLVGIQGSGKTTTAVKLAAFFQKRGVKTAVVCADTYRPGAFAQIKQLAKRVQVPTYGDLKEKDPVELAQRGINQFKDRGAIFIDTAGRHKDEKKLIKQMRDLVKKIKPDEVILVIDATIGQQAMVQAKAFHEATPIGSIFIAKLDGTARGGGALSAVAATGAPIRFIGIGERVDDIEEFDPPRFVGRLLGMGDVKSLVEKVKEARLEEEISKKDVEEFLKGKFTLETMYDQMKAVKRLGRFGKILSMIPGLGYDIPDEMLEEAEERMDKWKVIIQSMTMEERKKPELINSSRARRIARGSGTTDKEVRDLIRQYRRMKKALRVLRKKRGAVPPFLKGMDLKFKAQ